MRLMLIGKKPVIEPLTRRHVRQEFFCGIGELDEYLKRQAGQDMRRNVARVFVASLDRSPVIAGYYSLSAASIEFSNLPEDLKRKLPRYPIPAARIGRLAIDARHQGMGLGAYLLMDALNRVIAASDLVAMQAVIVDATGKKARSFYLHYGFQNFQDQPLKLFIPIKTVVKMRG